MSPLIQLEMIWFSCLLFIASVRYGASSSCARNPYISEFKLHYPLENELVPRAYHPTMGAEILISIEQFNLMQHEFNVCAIATQVLGSDVVEVFRECGRSIFGHALVNATDGWSDLSLIVHHKEIKICTVSTSVFCCANESTVAQTEEMNRQRVVSEFLQLGKQIADESSHSFLLEARRQMMTKRSEMVVVIGIKSSALNIAKRAAIRSTWLSELYTHDARHPHIRFEPYFLIGDSSIERDSQEAFQVLKMEQTKYGDTLLAAELPVQDTYYTLGQKVLSFLARVYATHEAKNIYAVVITDDDVFVDAWELKRYLGQLAQNSCVTSFYRGEVFEQRMHKQFFPVRDRGDRNYLPESAYPLSVLPPFALGNFYMLSGDLAWYLARNADMLKTTGTLEDVSISIWLMGLQVFPEHMSGVCDITRCLFDDNLYNAAPLSAEAPPERLLAVAGLQTAHEFDLLNQVVQHRKTQARGDSQDELSLMEWAVRNLLEGFVERKHKKTERRSPVPSSTSRCCRAAQDYRDDGIVQRVAVVLPNMKESTDIMCLLEMIWCEISADHLVDVVVSTVEADDPVRTMLAQSGVAVRYFPELAADRVWSTLEQAKRETRGAPAEATVLMSFLAGVDVVVAPRFEGESSEELSALQGLGSLLAHLAAAESVKPVTSVVLQLSPSVRALPLNGFLSELALDARTMKWQKRKPFSEHLTGINAFIAASRTISRVTPAVATLPPSLAKNTAALSQVNVVMGSQSTYAIRLAESLVMTALPSVQIVWFVIDMGTVLSKAPAIHRMSGQREVAAQTISADELLSLQTSRTFLLLSVLDCAELDLTQPEPHKQFKWTVRSQALMESSASAVGAFSTIFLSGEPLDLSSMNTKHVDVLLVTTTDSALLPAPTPDTFVHYLPVFSASFFERKEDESFSASALLRSRQSEQCETGEFCNDERKSRGVAHLYYRCDRVQREYFFKLLRSKSAHLSNPMTVEALGRCGGGSPEPHPARSTGAMLSRGATNYLDLATESYIPFKFVIAFENSFVDGYITEKLVNAYLAGAVPIYLGAADVSKYFNRLSMINCAEFVSLDACADHVIFVQNNATLYNEMRGAAPMLNFTVWSTVFPFERQSAHTSTSNMFVLQLQRKLNRNRV